MRKRFNIIFFGILIFLYGIINLVLFLLVNDSRLEQRSFWLAWAMFTWGNLLFDAIYFGYVSIKKINIANRPTLLFTVSGINIVFLLVNLVFALSGVNSTAIIITDSVLAFIAISITAYFFNSSKHVESIDKKQAKKVLNIKDLESDVLGYISQTNDSEIKESLENLAENIKNSDSTSDDSLEDIELDIKIAVANLSELISKDNKEEILTKINEIKDLVSKRNLKVQNLK